MCILLPLLLLHSKNKLQTLTTYSLERTTFNFVFQYCHNNFVLCIYIYGNIIKIVVQCYLVRWVMFYCTSFSPNDPYFSYSRLQQIIFPYMTHIFLTRLQQIIIKCIKLSAFYNVGNHLCQMDVIKWLHFHLYGFKYSDI